MSVYTPNCVTDAKLFVRQAIDGKPMDYPHKMRNTLFIAASCFILSLAGLRAGAQPLNDLDRGHRLLIEHGLQIQALVLDNVDFDPQDWADSGFTTVNWWAIPNASLMGPPPGLPWARWFGGRDIPTNTDLDATELLYLPNLVSLQAGDEQDLTDPATRQKAADTLADWRQDYPDVIGVLSQMSKDIDEWLPALDQVQPDLICGGVYELNDEELFLGEPVRRGGNYQKMLTRMMNLREGGMLGHAGSGGAPFPYGVYTQTFRQPSDGSDDDFDFIASEPQLRLQLFAAWAMGFKWVCAFIYNAFDDGAPGASAGYSSFFFDPDTGERLPGFDQYAQLNFESLNLAPALVRLMSTDVRIVSGRYVAPFCDPLGGDFQPCETDIPLPEDFTAWDAAADPYIEEIVVENLGGRNNGLPGDVMVGYFEPLHEDFDGPAFTGEDYFMLVNSMAYADATGAETRQRITLTFDFGNSGIDSLQRLSRFTGDVETVPLEPLGGNRYALELVYNGGEADLFKFNTGAPFIVANSPVPAEETTVTIAAPPSLIVVEGDTLTLTAEVGGDAGMVDYLWYRDQGAKSPALIAGATGATLEVENMTALDEGAYWVVVMANGDAFTSNVVHVTVVKPLPLAGAGLALLAVLILGVAGMRGPGRGVNSVRGHRGRA